MAYRDLREWLALMKGPGELKEIAGADWNLEIGAISQVARSFQKSRMFLFDNIKEYPAGFRVLTGALNSEKGLALTLGLVHREGGSLQLVRNIEERRCSFRVAG